MIEGWAVYAELMMLDSGYKNSDEMWLMYYKWNLRTTCMILDYSVHTKNMDLIDAMHLLIRSFQQQKSRSRRGRSRYLVSSAAQFLLYRLYRNCWLPRSNKERARFTIQIKAISRKNFLVIVLLKNI
jgi:uncharacterized protein (DUF885 family)